MGDRFGDEALGVQISCVVQSLQGKPMPANLELFSFLALLNTYLPGSYLLISECQKILGPPDPIDGGPPFEERMKPFTVSIKTSVGGPRCVCMVSASIAKDAVEILADLGISRSATMNAFMNSLCGNESEPHIIQFTKVLLTKREEGEKGKEKFSRLIADIVQKEDFIEAVNVLETASNIFRNNFIFPQTISRLYYIIGESWYYEIAEEWAMTAIERAPRNSYVADTLGKIYKNRLRETMNSGDVLVRAKEAFEAFEDVVHKAEKEQDPEMKEEAGIESISDTFNNRGLFGFIQVAKIAFEKLNDRRLFSFINEETKRNFLQQLKMKVEDKFDFFEWYLTYSKQCITTTEPPYFWRDIAHCYKQYTTRTASESTSFPGLLDRLNHGLFTSKGQFAKLEEAEETVSDLEALQHYLKATYEEDVDNVKAAETYILSNIILSNKMHNSSELTPVKELQTIIHRFLDKEIKMRSPEFYLLVLLLFWPEEQPQAVQEENDEELEDTDTEDDGSGDTTWDDQDSDEEQEKGGDTAQIPLEPMFDLDLQKYVTFMEGAFERSSYAKYLRGRYLLPLFFLGKGSGLSKWIHKSRLDAIVEEMVDAELPGNLTEKWRRINKMWTSGEVWHVQDIKNMLLPVQVCHCPMMPQGHHEQGMFVCVGGKNILAAEAEPKTLTPSPMLFYLGFTIQGPVYFKVYDMPEN